MSTAGSHARPGRNRSGRNGPPRGDESPWWVDGSVGEEPQPLVSARVVVGVIVVTIVLLTGYLVLGRALGQDPAGPALGYVPPSLGALPTSAPPDETTTTPGATASVPPTPPTPAPPTTPAPPGAATDAALASWLSSTGQPLSAEFEALVVRAQADIEERDLTGLGQECELLGELAGDIEDSPPPGSATDVATAWDQAAGFAAGAAADCASAIQTESLELLSSAFDQARSAAAYLAVAITTAEAMAV